jgi:CheY-like chemotaxis protein
MEATRLSQALARTKENFLASMSHEIRTPMNAILGMSTQLSKTTLTGQQQFYLDTIHSAADNLLVVINDILDLSKIEAGKLSLENIGFRIGPAVHRAMVVLSHKAEEKGLLFTNSLLDASIHSVLVGDPYRLNQILLNLISNAIKFTDKGSVDLRVFLEKDESSSQLVCFEVTDTGIGMDEDFMKNLFDKFSQEFDSTTRKYGGTGLGMSICKELIDLMGGSIAVSSAKGSGTIVSFRIPLVKGTEADLPVQEAAVIHADLLRGKKILVTDDNDMNRLVASTVLRSHGAEVVEAASGYEAVECLSARHIDVVLMDIQMPGISGLEATRLIRENGIGVPIIAMTANAFKGESEKCINAGMNDYLPKPFREQDLITVLCRWLVAGSPGAGIAKPYKRKYDLSLLREISRGNESFVSKMVQLFCQQAPEMVQQMKAAFQQGDMSDIEALAHKLKPSIDNLAIEELREPVRRLEKAGRNNIPWNEVTALLSQMENVILEVVLDVRQEA